MCRLPQGSHSPPRPSRSVERLFERFSDSILAEKPFFRTTRAGSGDSATPNSSATVSDDVNKEDPAFWLDQRESDSTPGERLSAPDGSRVQFRSLS